MTIFSMSNFSITAQFAIFSCAGGFVAAFRRADPAPHDFISPVGADSLAPT